jgi:signal transduction histidine kinase
VPGRKPLRVLLVEDSEDDALLVLRELERGGYQADCVRVDSQAGFRKALDEGTWDVIISDHALPQYSGLAALADLRTSAKDIPFILTSGTIGEPAAVAAIKAGAQDYVLKRDLTRLPVAVEREVREAMVRAERARIRERLIISERMASAGMLAAGVAHEINNPLAIAVLSLDHTTDAIGRIAEQASELKARGSRAAATILRPLSELEEPLSDLREALVRVRDIVRDVKLFSRPEDERPATVDVRCVADSSARMSRNEIKHRARLVKDYRDVPFVQANESRLGQVFLNLLVNAAQSVPEGRADQNEIRVATRTGADGSAIVEVADTGSGIAKENLARIFDPFFTTKPVGVGTGLGLAICHGIVIELGGRIEVESEEGRGSLFRVVLPAARESPLMMKAAVVQAAGPRSRLLVVDDDVAIGRALRRTLSTHHHVTAITRGTEVLARVAQGERFDVILLDVMMPDLSGMEVHAELQALAPDQAQRVIFLTGGAFSAAAQAYLDRVPNPKIGKPIESAALLALIGGQSPQAPSQV